MIPYGKQDISQDDIDAVVNALRSDFLTQGPHIQKFEESISDYCNVSHAVAVNSATSALHIACLALGLGKGDYMWTSPNTFVASANCGIYCGAQVDFVDIDLDTYNMCPVKLETKLKFAKELNTLPKIVMPVHFAGQSCDMRRINELSQEYDFRIIEDASHAIGGKYLGEPIGNCKYSDITVFSFHPVKIITTAEGGLATTNDIELSDKMRLLRSHGITRDSELMSQEPDGEWYYQQLLLGYNYRMTELQAALGVSQLNRLDAFVEKRHFLKEKYDVLLKDLPLKTPYQSSSSYSALHLYPILVDHKKIKKQHAQIFHELRKLEIGVNVHYIPVHIQPFYQDLGFKKGDFPISEDYYSRTISIPLHYNLSLEEQGYVVDSLKKVLV